MEENTYFVSEPAAEGAAEEAAPDAEATPVTTTASDNK